MRAALPSVRPAAAAMARAAPLMQTAGRRPGQRTKKDVEIEGTVLESLPNANFKVQLDESEQVILAHISGKIRKTIKILVGIAVTCEISPHDLTKGRITFRKR